MISVTRAATIVTILQDLNSENIFSALQKLHSKKQKTKKEEEKDFTNFALTQ